MNYTEVKGNLFKADKEYYLVHCISLDGQMGAGIAKTFRANFPEMPHYVQHYPKKEVGGLVPYKKVINLTTKQKYWQKPTRSSLNCSIYVLMEYCIQNDITKIAMPRIGSGLDRLNWEATKKYIKEVFQDIDIDIKVYYL